MVTKMVMPKQRGGGGGSNNCKNIVCGCLRSTCGRKMDGVHWPRAITPCDHIPGSRILHREAKRV
jgi:hypothetical protein